MQALEHEDFELLVHELLVAGRGGEGTTLRKLTPPDGGADSLVLGRDDAVAGAFQAKHSPDRTQASSAGGWANATPAWTSTPSLSVERMLDEHPHVAARFFGPDARNLHRSVARATKVGGAELETAADLVARAGELADFADELDPRFEYEQALGRREPHWAEEPYMSVVEETSERRYVRTAAFVRGEAEVPPVLIAFTDDQAGRAGGSAVPSPRWRKRGGPPCRPRYPLWRAVSTDGSGMGRGAASRWRRGPRANAPRPGRLSDRGAPRSRPSARRGATRRCALVRRAD